MRVAESVSMATTWFLSMQLQVTDTPSNPIKFSADYVIELIMVTTRNKGIHVLIGRSLQQESPV